MHIDDDQSFKSDSLLFLQWLSDHLYDFFDLMLAHFDVLFETVLLVVLDGLLDLSSPVNLRDTENNLSWVKLGPLGSFSVWIRVKSLLGKFFEGLDHL